MLLKHRCHYGPAGATLFPAYPVPHPALTAVYRVFVVMEQLGHSTIKLTMDTYSHVLPELQRQAADTMDTLFDAGD